MAVSDDTVRTITLLHIHSRALTIVYHSLFHRPLLFTRVCVARSRIGCPVPNVWAHDTTRRNDNQKRTSKVGPDSHTLDRTDRLWQHHWQTAAAVEWNRAARHRQRESGARGREQIVLCTCLLSPAKQSCNSSHMRQKQRARQTCSRTHSPRARSVLYKREPSPMHFAVYFL